MLRGFSEGQQQGTLNRVRRVPKSQPGPILDMRETGSTFYFILIYLEKMCRTRKPMGTFPRAEGTSLRGGTRCAVRPSRIPLRTSGFAGRGQTRGETSLFQAPLVFDAISWSGRALQRDVWSVFPWLGRKLQSQPAPAATSRGIMRAGPGPIPLNRSHSWRMISTTSSRVWKLPS